MTTSTEAISMTMRADWVPGPPQGCWTYEDYASIPEDGHRYEVIDGVLYMAAAPNIAHQTAIANFTFYLVLHVTHAGHGRVFPAPCDVVLPGRATPVQPDIVVVLNAHLGIITPGRIIGTPDLVVEILSPGTAGYDRREKQDAYARAGVPEYWVADPYACTIEPLRLDGGLYRSLGVFTGAATLPTLVIAEFPVRVEQFFL